MQAAPSKSLTVVGSTAGAGSEAGNTDLAKSRAEAIVTYLTREYGIDRSRFTVVARDLPDAPSNPDMNGGRAENRRVTFQDEGGLLNALVRDSVARTYSSPGFAVNVTSTGLNEDVPVQVSAAAGSQQLSTVQAASGASEVVRVPLDANGAESAARAGTVDLTVSGTSPRAESVAERTSLYVDVQTRRTVTYGDDAGNVQLQTPILFPYDSDSLGAREIAALKGLAESLPEESRVVITGYADDLGGADYNASLSRRRAERVARYFGAFSVVTRAGGSKSHVGADATPEERFYARTVSIEVVSAD
jgi:outer membrane protein OmpA-like peptidoglycan-associated protein